MRGVQQKEKRRHPMLEKSNPNAGRRPLPPENRRTVKRTANFTPREFEHIKQRAEALGVPIDRFIRLKALSSGEISGASTKVADAMNQATGELNTISARAAGHGEPLTHEQASELVSLIQTIIKQIRALKKDLEA